MSSPTLSVILITLNEADNIRDCLDSVAWADEIIVLDSGSQDNTVELCRQYTDHIYQTDWPGFGPQKNRALDKATGDWVLSIDADERVTEALRIEIQQAITTTEYPAYRLPRRSNYCGRFMQHGGWWPDPVIRLFRRGAGRFNNVLVHERLEINDPIGDLKNPLLHYTFRSLDDVVDTMNRYSSAGAQMLAARGKKTSLRSAIGHGLFAFFRTYILKAGFLDGREGFMLAVSNAEGTYYKHLKLLMHARNTD